MFTTRFQAWVRRNAQRIARLLGRLPITPNQVTVAGTLFTFVAAALAGFGQLRPAGIVLALSGTFDILDGALARATKRSYPYGAFLDSTFDRYSEGAVYVGVAAYFRAGAGAVARVPLRLRDLRPSGACGGHGGGPGDRRLVGAVRRRRGAGGADQRHGRAADPRGLVAGARPAPGAGGRRPGAGGGRDQPALTPARLTAARR
ncbi:MAG: CDP-alcohol phosphatidyltransferase family protein [Chloroflexi bacterium]|nr:MAG: CDP-alcohol phosphatidyltransferase family protein [Chloroflexota bacterium]